MIFEKFSITFILICILFYILYRYLTRNYNYWQLRNVPCERPTFIVGNAWDVFSGKMQVAKFLGKFYNKYKNEPYFGIYIFDKPYFVLRSPEIIQKILVSDFNNFSDRIFACDKNADSMSGNSVFLLRNPRWRIVRAKLTQIFTLSKLKLMFPIMRDVGVVLENYLKNFNGKVIDIKEVSARYMTDVTALCFFGFEPNSFECEDNIFRQVGRKLFDFNVFRTSFSMFAYFFVPSLVSLLKLSFTDKESTQFLRDLLAKTIENRKKLNIKRNDFVDLFLSLKDNINSNNSIPFDDDTIVSQAITFFLAGFESTSNVISFTLYELCIHSDIQDKLRNEIKTIIKDKDITFDLLQQLKYLDQVIAETMRKYPFAPFLNRKCKENYMIKETGFVIEKGTQILIPTDGIHFDPEFYPEPDKFIPERFDSNLKYTTTTYMPFGAGPRFCIGDRFGVLAAKVSLVYFLKNFKIDSCELTPKPILLNPRSPFVMSVGGLPAKIFSIQNDNEISTTI